MKAIKIDAYGGSEVLQLTSIDKPTPKDNQVLVQIKAAGINPFDVKLVAGYMKAFVPLHLPTIVAGDFAGIVTEVGKDITEFAVGDEVYGQAGVYAGGSGAFAEYAVTTVNNIAKKPTNTSFEEAAGLPLVGSSAVQALEEHIKLQKGQKILIHGGAGGIGHVAVQLAKALGAYVATTVSTQSIDFVKQFNPDEIIDYKEHQFEKLLKDFDAVYDTVGGETTNKSFKVIKKGGVLVTMLGAFDQNLADQYGVTAIGQMTKTNSDHLIRVARHVENGDISVRIAGTFPLEEAKEAFDLQNTNPQGKVVLKVQ